MTDQEKQNIIDLATAIAAKKERREQRKREKKKPMEFSKKLLVWLFAWANIVLLYSMIVMYSLQDLSALSVLITIAGGEAIAGIIWYMKKSASENVEKIKKGGPHHEYRDLPDQEEYQTE